MSLENKRRILIVLSLIFMASLIFVQKMEVARKQEEVGMRPVHIVALPAK